MKTNKIQYIILGIIALCSVQCTDLTEKTYDIITTETFYQSEENIIQAFVRPFEHAYWTCARSNQYAGESTADHFITPKRDGSHFYDGGIFFRMHYHTWTIDDPVLNGWNDYLQGAGYVNSFIQDMENLSSNIPVDQAIIDNYVAQARGLRAWFYLRLLDQFRNVPIITTVGGTDLPEQAEPKETFDFIEKEILEILPYLNTKSGTQGNGNQQGEWTKATAAMTLVRLYLNAELWVGENRLDDCATYCKKIIDGEYGHYEIDERWDAPFDWDNQNSKEIIYAFTSSYGGTHWIYSAEGLLEVGPFNCSEYFNSEWNTFTRFGLSPSLDLQGNEYPYELGKPVAKFKKYPDDIRLKKYKNLGNSRREGMFLYGYLENNRAGEGYVKNWPGEYDIYIRDQVGHFRDTDPSSISPNPTDPDGKYETKISSLEYADESSGWYVVKYPIYPKGETGAYEADYAVFRLAEAYYSLAEVYYRKGNNAEAAKLLNTVRKRYYPEGSSSLYNEDGSQITKQEMLDEWGREFIAESLRRTVLCRFGEFTSAWWDKPADPDNHTMIFPLSRSVMQSNSKLVQNPGYPAL